MKKLTYFLAIYEDEKGGYWTKFADFDCLVDQGDTIEQAIENSTAFLDSCIEDWVDNNEEFAQPTNAKDFLLKLDKEDGTPTCIVPITVYPPAKTERINLTMKGNLLAEIDDFAKFKNMNRSKLMVQATLEYIHNNRL